MPQCVHPLFMSFFKKYSNLIFIILYGVGILGFQLEVLSSLFLTLVPGFLLLSLVILLLQHPNWSRKFGLWALAVFLFGIGIEWLGIKTSAIFGSYHYGEALGWKIAGVPLVIGVNWLLLAYCSKDIAERIFKHKLFAIVFAACMMVFLDFLIEPVAIQLEFWYWPDNVVPLRNYIGWFFVSLLLFGLSTPFNLHWENRSSVVLFLCMLVFFAALNFYS